MIKRILFLLTLIVLIGFNTQVFAEDTTDTTDTTEATNQAEDIDYNKKDAITEKYGFTLREEKEIGFQSAIILTKRYGYYNNPKVNNYVNSVGKNIAAKVSKRPDIDYNFYVLDTPEINAFAVPGGFIFITKGALKVLSNEAELAGILAHEIAHVELGHGLESIASNPKLRDKVRILKLNLQEGKGFTQQSFKSLASKEGNITTGIVNSGELGKKKNIILDEENNIILEKQ